MTRDNWEEIDPREILIGFDRIYDQLAGGGGRKMPTYPPYNILKLSENSHVVEIATAGFDQEELDISVDKNLLKVKGAKSKATTDSRVAPEAIVHRGLAQRDFELNFKLAEYVEVDSVVYLNGVLSIKLMKFIPEEKQPKKIRIGYSRNDQEAKKPDTLLNEWGSLR